MLPCWLAASFLTHSCNPSWILEGTKHNDILFGHFNQFDFPAARDGSEPTHWQSNMDNLLLVSFYILWT